jgi:hypothetical protein
MGANTGSMGAATSRPEHTTSHRRQSDSTSHPPHDACYQVPRKRQRPTWLVALLLSSTCERQPTPTPDAPNGRRPSAPLESRLALARAGQSGSALAVDRLLELAPAAGATRVVARRSLRPRAVASADAAGLRWPAPLM